MVPSHKRARVHDNFKSEYLILKLKVWNINANINVGDFDKAVVE